MRMTFAVYLELSLDRMLPGFFDAIAEYPFAKNLDRGAFRIRYQLHTIEVENVTESEEANCRQAVERVGNELVHVSIANLGLAVDGWRQMGRIYVERVADAPQPSWAHGMSGENPAVLCPECQSPMVARQGQNARKPFYGCSRFPQCRGSRSVSQ